MNAGGEILLGQNQYCHFLVLFVAGWFLCFIPWIVGIPWWIVDIFLIQNATRKYNAEKVMQALSFIS